MTITDTTTDTTITDFETTMWITCCDDHRIDAEHGGSWETCNLIAEHGPLWAWLGVDNHGGTKFWIREVSTDDIDAADLDAFGLALIEMSRRARAA